MKCRSEWHRPATAVRIRTSRGPGLGRLTASIISGLLTSYRTAAFIVFPRVRFPTLMSSPLLSAEAKTSLRCQKQFANLGQAGRTLAEQQGGDRALPRIFREPERIARREAVIEHQARE